MRQHPVVLCLQDTTELDFNGQSIEGLGPLSYEAQRGLYLHPTYVVTPDREPLGVIDAWLWAREFKDADGNRPGILESTRWIEGYERVTEAAVTMPGTRLVYVADREADILGLMQRAQALETPADWLVRSQHNRCLPAGGKLWAKVRAGEALGEIEFLLPARGGQAARLVRQRLFACPRRVAQRPRRTAHRDLRDRSGNRGTQRRQAHRMALGYQSRGRRLRSCCDVDRLVSRAVGNRDFLPCP
jgi:hypothetical protein